MTTLYRSVDPSTGRVIHTAPALDWPAAAAALTTLGQNVRRTAHTGPAPLESLPALHRLGQLLAEQRTHLAHTIAQEVGKPLRQALAEVDKCADMVGVVADITPGALWPARTRLATARAVTTPHPMGVILGVMPSNYPLWQALRCIAPNVAVGNTVAIKPAPSAWLCAQALDAVLTAAGLHPFARHLALATADVARAVCHPAVQGVVVVGGPNAGAAVAEAAGRARKKVVLELGGADAYVVLSSADLDLAAAECSRSRFKNSGQACLSAKRIIVEDSVYDAFVERFIERVDSLVLGPALSPDTTVGPLATEASRARIHAQVTATLERGATLLRGGHPIDGPGHFYAPTVLIDVAEDSPAATEEVFGPVASIFRVRDAHHALTLANSSEYGLGAAVFADSADPRAAALTARLEAGTVALNGPATSDPRLPFGGCKGSGFGVELGVEGLLEFTVRRVQRSPRFAGAELRLDRMDHLFMHRPEVVDAARRVDEALLATYSSEGPHAERSLSAYLARLHGVDERRVALTHGGSDALMKLLLWARTQQRTHAIVQVPVWRPLLDRAADAGLAVVSVAARTLESGAFHTDLAAIDAQLRTHPRAVVVLATPNNPTGHSTRATDIAQLAEAHPGSLWIIDSVHAPLGRWPGPLAHLDHVLCVGSFSSQLGLPGLRVGFVVGAVPAWLQAPLGWPPSTTTAMRWALDHRDTVLSALCEARAAAHRLGQRRGRLWRGVPTDAAFALTRLDPSVSEDTVDKLILETRTTPGRVELPCGHALLWTCGPPGVQQAIDRFLDALDATA